MSQKRPPHLARLNPEQYRAATTLEGPLLILAGAGSGKTGVLTARVVHLLHTGVDPKNVMAITFTNKASAEMKERIGSLLQVVHGEGGEELAKRVWCSTFHSSCARILRTDIENLGWTRRFAIYDDDDQLRLLKEIIRRHGYDEKETSPREMRSRIDYHKTRLHTPDSVVAQMKSHLNSTLISVWREYEDNLKAADAVDFNDLIGLTVRLFREHPDVLQKWQNRFRYIMVDEYQDTNQQQYDLLRLLAPDDDSNLGVVGDDDQSIYGFRGADVSNILNFEKDYPKATVIKLEQNYRCSGNILHLANVVVAKNTGRFEKKLWTNAAPGAEVKLRRFSGPSDEASQVASAIHKAHTRLGHAYGDIAIIYRTNATSRVFEAALRKLSIPHRIVGGRKFHDHREIRDVLGYLRLVVNPADDAAMLRIVNVPSRGIGAKSLEKLRKEAERRGVPLLAAARGMSSGADAVARKFKAFVEVMNELTDAARNQSPDQLVGLVLERTGYLAGLKADKARENENRITNLAELLVEASQTRVDSETEMPMDRLRAWLDLIALAGQTDEIPDGGEVTLMTVHCAKGLEYPVVFVVHMMQGVFPHKKSLETALDEERRLAYVAFTRAKELLVVTRSSTMPVWSDPGNAAAAARNAPKEAEPSAFLYGLPAEAVSGDIPTLRPETAPDDSEQRMKSRRNAFLRNHSQFHTHHEPDGNYALIEVTELEQLSKGVTVKHGRRGFGVIKKVSIAGGMPRVSVDFGGSSSRTATVSGTELEIVVE